MSFDALRIGASGVTAASKGVDVAGHNVSNVNTDGYTRQRVVQTANRPAVGASAGDGMRGTGVTVSELQRLRSAFADSAWRSQAAVASDAQATATVMTRVESLLGEIDNGLPVAVNDFYAAFAALSVTPTDPAARNGVLAAGDVVADQLNTLARELRQIGPDSTSKAVDLTARINGLAAEVAQLNVSIADALSTGQQPSDLLDNRDRALDQLAQLIGARAGQPDAQGRVDVFLGGEPLVRGRAAYPLTATPTPTGPAIAFTDGRVAVLSGELGGLVHTSTVTVPDILARFDEWTAEFVTMVNDVHAAGFGADGVSGRPFFTGTTAAGVMVDPGLTADMVAASESGSAYDGNNALTLSQVSDIRDGAGTTIGDRLRGRFSHIGLVSQQAKIMSSSTSQVQRGLEMSRLAEHSVSVDEEMVDMVRYQRAYEAAARVISVADQLLDTLINRTGR